MNKRVYLFLSLLCFSLALLFYFYGKSKYDQPLEQPTEVVLGTDFENTYTDIGIEVVDSDMVQEKVTGYKSVLQIPKQDILVNIYEGVSKEDLKRGVCRYDNTSVLGGVGLTVICGHSSNRWDYVFNSLDEVKTQDIFHIWDAGGKKHDYLVTKIFIVEPNEVWILEQEPDLKNKVRLFCCAENGTKRLVVEAEEIFEPDLQKFKEKLLSINDNLILSSTYSELINFGKKPIESDSNLPKDFDSGFGIYFKERSN